jgi:hypothetical protein
VEAVDSEHPDQQPLIQTRYQMWRHEPNDIEPRWKTPGFGLCEI